MKKGDWIYFHWGAGQVYGVKFVRWYITRMNTGGEDTNKLGVGVLVESDWLFGKITLPKIPHGCVRGQDVLRPYTSLHKTYNDAWNYRKAIKRPTVEQVRELEKQESEWVPWPWSK